MIRHLTEDQQTNATKKARISNSEVQEQTVEEQTVEEQPVEEQHVEEKKIDDEMIYHSGKYKIIITNDVPYIDWNKHVLLVCPDSTEITIITPIKYIHRKSSKIKKCFVKKSIVLTLLETNMELNSTDIVLGKKNIRICFGKLLQEEQEYQMISDLIKKNICDILILDNMSNNLSNKIMENQFNELIINTDFIIKNNKIIIELFS